ncbi:MAG: glutathione peroxidase, partial [Clostridia bacterium]|nr:glutathione peroxidase [Clostridia bacterium]
MSVYDYKVKANNGKELPLSQFEGKVLLIVNTASGCGFTPQYVGLQKLYDRHKDEGLEILGFPSNQFLNKEPGTDEQISSFCSLTYGVTFPLFAKSDVRGENANPLFRYLSEAAPFKGFELDKEMGRRIHDVVAQNYPENLEGNGVKWNFTKFLVGRDGEVKVRFEPT